MDNEKFKEFIKQVAEVKELKPVTSGERPAEGQTDVLYKGQWISLDKRTNPTLGFKFIKLKGVSKKCELGCGRRVVNQSFERKLHFYPEKHWRTKCVNCNKFLGPDGQLIDGGCNIQNEYMKHLRKRDK